MPDRSHLASCTVRLDKLQLLAPSLLPVIANGPVAVMSQDQACFYLVSPLTLQSLLAGTGLPHQDIPQVMQQAAHSEPTFRQVADKLIGLEAQRVDRGDYSVESLNIMRNRLRLHILPLLGELPISRVDVDAVGQLMTRLTEAKSSSTTISQYLVIVRKVLNIANERGWVRELPVLPKVNISNKPRASFSVSEYRRILRTAKRLIRDQVEAPHIKQGDGTRDRFWITARYRTLPPDMYWVLVFMVNSFVRPSDIKVMQHGHVDVVKTQHSYLRLNLPTTKKHDKPIVTLQPAVRVYEALKQAADRAGHGGHGDHVFLPYVTNREHALALFNFWLKWILREAKLPLTDNHGQVRTLYCLRHTAITFRLLYGQGIDMLTLARNARTSVDMIENFYASTLSGEMNVGMLQSRRSQKKTPSLATRG